MLTHGIQSDSLSQFTSAVNEFGKTNDVRFTQTHVTVVVDKPVYTAILFYKED